MKNSGFIRREGGDLLNTCNNMTFRLLGDDNRLRIFCEEEF